MFYLSQRDPLWAEKHLGASDLTVGRYGCTTTCISMLTSYFGGYSSPLEIASNAYNYTKDGLIIWSHLSFPFMRPVQREYGRNDAGIQAALGDPNRAVILQVNNGQHWVVAVKKNKFGYDYTIIDPWDGQKKNCLANYGNITGAEYFERKGVAEPSSAEDLEYGKKLGARDYPFFLQVDQHGELWFIHPDGEREYLAPGNIIDFMKQHATGITDQDLAKVPIKKV